VSQRVCVADAVAHSGAVSRFTLQHTATHCNTLQHTFTVAHSGAVTCLALQHTATHCNTLQHTATHIHSCAQWGRVPSRRFVTSSGITLQSRAHQTPPSLITGRFSSTAIWYICGKSPERAPCIVTRGVCVAVRCSVLQCVAACCRMLPCVAVCCSVLQRVAMCCSVLQRVAVCCRAF